MAQPQMLQIKLSRFDAQPWGFRLQGGVDFAAPLLVQKVNGGSLAEQAGLQPGDAVLMINDVDVFNLKHKDAQDIVVRSGNNFVMTIQRGGSTWKPHVTPTGNLPQPNSPYLQTVTKTSLAHHQPDSQHIGCGYNNSARPFANGGGDGNVKSIVNKQYNTPVGIYSEESIAETLSAQAEVLAGGVLGVNFKKNEKEYQADKSEVLKFLREEESGQSSTPAFISEDPTQQEAHYQQKQQQQQYQQQQQHQHQPQHQYQPQQQQQNYQQQQQYQSQQQYQQQQQNYQQQSSATRHVSAPVNTPKPPSTGGLPTGQNICTECERLITGVFVRIKDKNLHVECFRCATCGTSLKNQGYYNFNNKLYCDVHAKLAALQNPPSGTDGYVPVPIKPNTKLSANTISSALNAHGYNNGVSNGNSTPTPAPQEDLTDLPLPPPPSPTQLQEYENESQLMYTNNNNNNTINSYIPNNSLQNSHTRTNSSLSTMSSNSAGTSSASMSPIPPAQQNENAFRHNLNNHNNNNSMSGASTLSLDHSYGSPMHSREASSSSSSLLGSGGSYDYEQSKSVPLPPPPPPPMPSSEHPLYINAIKTKTENNQRNIKMLQQQQQQQNAENDMNVQNKNVAATNTVLTSATPAITAIPTNNAYNKLLKEYSNKLLTQNGTPIGQQHHTQDTNNTTTQNAAAMPMKELTHNENNNSSSHNNNNLKNQINNNGKSFNGIAARTFTPQQIAAASAATLATSVNSSQLPAATTKNANPLKFNSKQVSANKFAPPPALPTTTFPPAPAPATPLLEQIDCINTAAANSLNSNIKSNSSHQLDNMSMSMLDLDYQQQQQQQQQEQSIFGQINVQNQINNFNAGQQQGGQSSSDQPFEYVTLTGNVIRSVVPPGKGVNINYKVNQGYARPFGASAGGPPAGAPKSPMSYPPQQQQQQQWNQPQPAGNNYATLPRAAAGGQQAPNNPSTNTNTELNNATLPRKAGPLNKPMKPAEHQPQVADNATAMLTESLSKLDVDNKMGQNFMAEAGKIISNMLEARLAGNHPSGGSNTLGQSLSHGGSAQSMHSNNSGSTRSPMVVRKRLDLDDFKNLDPTKPVALHPVVVANVTPHLNATADQSFKSNAQIAQPQQKSKTNGQSLTNEMPNNHAMGKLLDMCDNKPTLLKKPTTPLANSNNNKMPVFQPIRKDIVQPKPIAMPLKDVKFETSATEAAMHSPVVLRQTGRGNGERSTHAIDRRSYIEAPPSTATNNNTVLKPQATPAQPQALAQAQTPPKPAQPKSNNDNAPAFCVSVKALNGQDENTPMSAENEQVVSQFLKDGKKPICCQCDKEITSGPFITALGRIWCPDHFICVNGNCRRPLQDIGFVEEKGDLYCEYCFEKYLAPTCSKCNGKIKGDCLNAIGRHFHPECFSCTHCGKVFGNSPFFLEEGNPYCEADWNELFTTKCFACGFPVEAGDRWVEALNHNYHSQCFNCTFCKQNLEGQSFYNKGGRPFCKNHAR